MCGQLPGTYMCTLIGCLCCSDSNCTHARLSPFYHPFYPDVTHVRKTTRPSTAFPYCKRWEARWGLRTGLHTVIPVSLLMRDTILILILWSAGSQADQLSVWDAPQVCGGPSPDHQEPDPTLSKVGRLRVHVIKF